MNNKNGIFLLVFLALVVGSVIFFVIPSFQSGARGLNQSSTTTELSKQSIAPSPPPVQSMSTPTLFAFGPLVHTYEDKDSGFSMKYPDELKMSFPDCAALNDKQGDGLFSIKVCFQEKKKAVTHFIPEATSLTDYTKNYSAPILGTKNDILGEYRYVIKDTKEITTSSGAKGLEQTYDLLSIDREGNVFNTDSNVKRYVFFKTSAGAIIFFLSPYNSPELEHAVVQSVNY